MAILITLYPNFDSFYRRGTKSNMPHHTFESLCGTTSDHAWRSIAVTYMPGFKIQGATWNMLMWCSSKEDTLKRIRDQQSLSSEIHSNNPLNITETKTQFFERKYKQIEELGLMINSGADFILLQEADWNKFSHIRQMYIDFLLERNWGMVESNPHNKTCQNLVILYNVQKLIPVPESSKMLFRGTYNFRGFRHDFIETTTNKKIALVNLHLEYGRDYQHEIIDVQRAFIAENVHSIMGGDINNVQGENLSTMFVNKDIATTFSSNQNGGYTTQHVTKNNQATPFLKAYDGFFIAPAQNTMASIEEKEGRYFDTLEDGTIVYKDYLPVPRHYYLTLTGKPWQLFTHVLMDLDKVLSKTENPVEKAKLMSKMRHIGHAYLAPEIWHALLEDLIHFSNAGSKMPAVATSTVEQSMFKPKVEADLPDQNENPSYSA